MEGRAATVLYTPAKVPLPITIQRLHVRVNDQIKKTQPLYSYSYEVTLPDGTQNKIVKVYDSPIEGTLVRANCKPGQVVHAPAAHLLFVEEPCTHDVQLHGLCALCGKDLTGTDYTGYSDQSRAEIAMVHDVGGLTVSYEEASRLEAATTARLLDAKKLSLIVDLDQTIIHATVDPTVGEWLADASNPNHSALEGVKSFRLGMTSGDTSADDGCTYYVKKRPGLDAFLKDLAEIYEMHVYTMGTRAYAIEVCNVIDPDGKLFGGRILSRDESGSLTRKSLQRLFPCENNMVVIIDDRADVWDGVPNLVKVIPYDFFVGIGDINSAFLPPTPASPLIPPSSNSSSTPPTSQPPSDGSISPSDTVISPSMSEAEASTAQTLTDQIESRPLAAMANEQAQKEKRADRSELDSDDDDDEEDEDTGEDEKHGGEEQAHEPAKMISPQEAVLKDDDRELDRLFKLLKSIRDTFYLVCSKNATPKTPRYASVTDIIPSMKARTLASTSIVFSGLVALGTPASQSEWWRIATSFGAHCAESLSSKTTHLVAKEAGTAKVHQALRMKGVSVVRPTWLLESVARWEKVDENEYLLIPPEGEGEAEEEEEDEDDEILRLMEEASPAPLDEEDDLDEEALRRMAAQDDLDAELGDVDWANAEKEIEDALAESEYDSDASDRGGAKATGKKRARTTGGSSTDDEGPNGKHEQLGWSPLQKRVKTSRARSSKLLKVSFPPEDDTATALGPPSSSQASSRNDETASSDDEAFFASMAEEVEKEWLVE